MPITKTRSSKAAPAKILAYIMDPEKVIACGTQALVSTKPEGMAKQMMQTMHMHKKGFNSRDRKYYHTVVSFHPDDRPENGGNLTKETGTDYARRYAAKMWPNCEVAWALQDHEDGECIHIHFVVCACERDTGKMLDIRDAEYRTWKDYANELAKEYGLSTLDWRKATKKKREREAETGKREKTTFAENGLRSRGKISYKDEIRDIIDRVVSESATMKDFEKKLNEHDVELTRNSDSIISYQYKHHKACRGDSLGDDYTAKAISQAIARNRREYYTPIERSEFRAWGKMVGIKREEIDALCDRAAEATWAEKQAVWQVYKDARDEFWVSYNRRKEKLQVALDEAYNKKRQAREMEWVLNPRNRRSSVMGIIYAGVMLHQEGGSEFYERQIQIIKGMMEDLKRTACEFKKESNAATEILKEKHLTLDEYLGAIELMQEMSEDIVNSRGCELEKWEQRIKKGSLESLAVVDEKIQAAADLIRYQLGGRSLTQEKDEWHY